MPSLPAIAPFLGDTSRLISYRKFSEASAVGFLSAILFVVFSEPLKTYVDFGEKWMSLSGLPYQMNTAMLGFIVGFGFVKIFLLMRIQLFKMLLNYQGWMTNPKSMATKVNITHPPPLLSDTYNTKYQFLGLLWCSLSYMHIMISILFKLNFLINDSLNLLCLSLFIIKIDSRMKICNIITDVGLNAKRSERKWSVPNIFLPTNVA